MTRKERQHLAGSLASAAADMLERRYGDDDAVLIEAKRIVAGWLSRLPGDEWDVRLPQPGRMEDRQDG